MHTLEEAPWPMRVETALMPNGIAVAITKEPWARGQTGVVTITPTVTLPDGSKRTLNPISIVIEIPWY